MRFILKYIKYLWQFFGMIVYWFGVKVHFALCSVGMFVAMRDKGW